MPREYRLLEHRSFRQQRIDFLSQFSGKERPLVERQLTDALKKLLSDPFSAQTRPIRDLKTRKVQNITRRIYVGGNKRYRLIYLCPPNCNILIPFYLSPDTRDYFDYDEHIEEIESLAVPILDDYANRRYDQFFYWSDES